MNWISRKDDFQKYANNIAKVKVQCRCGRKTVMPIWNDKQICSWCGHYVFRDPRKEFQYRMRERLCR